MYLMETELDLKKTGLQFMKKFFSLKVLRLRLRAWTLMPRRPGFKSWLLLTLSFGASYLTSLNLLSQYGNGDNSSTYTLGCYEHLVRADICYSAWRTSKLSR